MKDKYRILVINPGSTSTKVALYENDKEIWNESIYYTKDELSRYNTIIDQFDLRKNDIYTLIDKKQLNLSDLNAVVGRGGPFKPLKSGTYKISNDVLEDVRNGKVQAEHISNIGVLLAHEIAEKASIPSFFVDPVSVDEFEPVARISGIPELERKSLLHALNVKATAHIAAREMGKSLDTLNLIVAHLGGGISICPLKKGRVIDVNNANEGGPFSPERAGSLPSSSLVKLCFSEKFTYKELKKRLVGNGGLIAYLGTNDLDEVLEKINTGDKQAKLILDAMIYQISKEIGAMAAVLRGKVDAILLTGGIAHQDYVVKGITEMVEFITEVRVYAGENEMKSLAQGVLRVMKGEEEDLEY
ncbi:MAG: butyrate kinase [bacterium]